MSFSIGLLKCVSFLDLLAVGLIIPLVPNHVRQMGGSHIEIGALGSIYAGFQLVSGPLIGSLSDIKGRKSILVMTMLICSIAYIMMGITTSIAVILIMRAVLGLFKQTQMLTRALVPDYVKDEMKQSEIYGKMAAISGIGITIGPVIGGHLAEDYPEYGLKLIAVAVGVCFAANAGLVYFLPDTKIRPATQKSRGTASINILQNIYNSLKQSVIEIYNVEWSQYWDIFILKALVGFAMGVYYSNYSLYLKTVYELSPKYIGYVISFQGTIGSISSYFMGTINRFYEHDCDYSIRNFHVFVIIFISLIGLICSFHIYMYAFWLVPLAIGNSVARLVSLEMVLNRSHGEHRGTLIGASNSVRSLAGVVAPMVAGFIGQYFGVSYVIYASVCSTFIGLVLSYRCRYIKVKKD